MKNVIEEYKEYQKEIGVETNDDAYEGDINGFLIQQLQDKFDMSNDELIEMFKGDVRYRVPNAFARELDEVLQEHHKEL